MFLLITTVLAEPCTFTGVTEETETTPGLEYAWDEDRGSWATGSSFELGLVLEGRQVLEQVGVVVFTEQETNFDLDIWYLPEDGTSDYELVNSNGTLVEGMNVGEWNASTIPEELLYSLNTTEEVSFQVICESGPTYNFQGGGGCEGCSFGLGNGATGLLFLPLWVFTLRRRRK